MNHSLRAQALAILAALALAFVAAEVVLADLVGSIFDQPTSECGEDEVIFAKHVSGDEAAWMELDQGLYKTRIVAEAPPPERSNWKSRPYVYVRSWQDVSPVSWDMRLAPSALGTTEYGGFVGTPGGVAEFTVKLSRAGQTSTLWRWEIIRAGLCGSPGDSR